MDPSVGGQWSAPFDMGGVAIHATLTHTGDVLFFQYVEGAAGVDHSSYVGTWNYLSGIATEAPFSYDRDVFCAGNNVLPDGKVFIAGGHDHTTGQKLGGVGVAETDTYDPTTRSWAPGPLLSQKRWYPTNVGMPDGRTLIFGGQARKGEPSTTVDQYDPATNTMTQLPPTATKPVGVYPRMHVMPNGKVLKTGPARMSTYFDPATNTWKNVAAMQYGARRNGSSILLPGAGQVMAIGGQSPGAVSPTGTVEILDTSVAAPKWRYTTSLTYPRMHANSVVLPDGQVLVVGGGTQGSYMNPVKTPELFNPSTETWTPLSATASGADVPRHHPPSPGRTRVISGPDIRSPGQVRRNILPALPIQWAPSDDQRRPVFGRLRRPPDHQQCGRSRYRQRHTDQGGISHSPDRH